MNKYGGGGYELYSVQTGPRHGQGVLCGFVRSTSQWQGTLSLYLSIVSLVYCVILTMILAFWAFRYHRNAAFTSFVASQPRRNQVVSPVSRLSIPTAAENM